MWELDCEESWAQKNWCFWTVVLDKTLESPLNCKGIQPVHLKGNQSWVFIGGTDVETEAPTIWPPDAKSWVIWQDPDAWKDWGQEKGTREDEMVGRYHWLDGHGFGWALVVGDGEGGPACCASWGHEESDTTEWLNWTELNWTLVFRRSNKVTSLALKLLIWCLQQMWSVWECWYLTSMSCILGPSHFIKAINDWLHVIQVAILPGYQMDEKHPWKDVGVTLKSPTELDFKVSLGQVPYCFLLNDSNDTSWHPSINPQLTHLLDRWH